MVAWDPRFQCNDLISSYNTPPLLPPNPLYTIMNEANRLISAPLLPLVLTPAPSSSPTLSSPCTQFYYNNKDNDHRKYKDVEDEDFQ